MNTNFRVKMLLLLAGFALSAGTPLFAANFNNDEFFAVTPPVSTSGQIIRVTVHFIDNIPGGLASGSPVNTGIALSQEMIAAWTEYSAYVRFDNADASATGIIDARNDGAMAAVNNMYFDLLKSYYIWFTVNPAEGTYSVSAQDASTSAVVEIASGYTMRFKPITSIGYVSILHNGDNGDNVILKIDEVTYPEIIEAGPVIDQQTSVIAAPAEKSLKAVVSGGELQFGRTVQSVEIFDLVGRGISKASNVSSVNIGLLPQGLCIIRTEAGMMKFVK